MGGGGKQDSLAATGLLLVYLFLPSHILVPRIIDMVVGEMGGVGSDSCARRALAAVMESGWWWLEQRK